MEVILDGGVISISTTRKSSSTIGDCFNICFLIVLLVSWHVRAGQNSELARGIYQ